MKAAVEPRRAGGSRRRARIRDITLPPILARRSEPHDGRRATRRPRACLRIRPAQRASCGPQTIEMIESGLAISADAYDDARRDFQRGARRAIADLMADLRCDPLAIRARRRTARVWSPPALGASTGSGP